MRILTGVFAAALLVAGCTSKQETQQAEPPTLQLAANQIVIGERVTFAGKDGKPVTTRPGVYRVGTRGSDTLELYFGSATKPYLVRATTKQLNLARQQQGALKHAKAVLRVPSDAAREVWLCMPDGTVHGSAGIPDGARMRGDLLAQTTAQELATAYGPAQPALDIALTITAPTDNETCWNRIEPLRVTWAGGGALISVSLVQRVTQRAVRNQTVRLGQAAEFDIAHVDPGEYDVVLTDHMNGVTVHRGIRVVGAVQSLSCSDSHCAAIDSDGEVWVWGNAEFGQCGQHGSEFHWPGSEERDGPWEGHHNAYDIICRKPAKLGIRGVAVHCSPQCTYVISAESGGIVAYSSIGGSLKSRPPAGSTDPRPYPAPLNSGIVQMTFGTGRMLALKKENGTSYVYAGTSRVERYNSTEVVPLYLQDVVAIAGGRYHAIALCSDGSVWGWGSNENGQLGPWVHTEGSPRARRLWTLDEWDIDVRAVYCGHRQTCLLTGSKCYRFGSPRKLEDPAAEGIRSQPVAIYTGSATHMSVSSFHPTSEMSPHLILAHTGVTGAQGAFWKDLFCRGDNGKCALGSDDPQATRCKPRMPADVVVVASGAGFSTALCWDSGEPVIYGWGTNRWGCTGGEQPGWITWGPGNDGHTTHIPARSALR